MQLGVLFTGIPRGQGETDMSEFNNENREIPEDGENPEIPDDLSSLEDTIEYVDPELNSDHSDDIDGESQETLLEKLSAERDEYLKSLQQTAADFDNYRKRVTKQSQEFAERNAEALVVKLLPALDNIELALTHSKDNPELAASLTQISNALFDVLTKEGLELISVPDVDFDPTCHDAVMHEPGEGSAKVSEILRTGYKWKQRVIRPAMVKVVGQG